ncbi:MAG TPA: IPT/TIG domain-containing protein, partial [Dehalococcoidia bacterium]|nr:IPT/TIG domain-containing protein [Dehalococcoidia bacterium]
GPFTSSLNLTADTSQLTFTFPAGVDVSGVTALVFNGVTPRVNGVAAATSSVTGQVVTVTVPQNIAAGTDITVELPRVVNPATAGVGGITVDDTAGAPVGTTVGIPVTSVSPQPAPQEEVEGIASPDTAGQLAEYQFTFSVAQNIPANVGEVRVIFDKDTLVPDLISQNGVQFQASLLTNALGTGNVGPGGADQVVSATTAPVLDVDDVDPRRRELIVKVPDMDPTTGDVGQAGQGVQGIAAGARVRILVTTNAGVRNPTERETSEIDLLACPGPCINGNSVIAGAPATASVEIRNVVRVNDVDGARGAEVTITGLGYNNGTTATVWLDNGFDSDGDGIIGNSAADLAFRDNGIKEAQERELGNVVVSSDDTFTLQITVGNPPFGPGTLDETTFGLDLNGDGDATDTSVNFNVINAIDGEARVADANDVSFYELEPTVRVSPAEANILDRVTVSLFDYPPSTSVTAMTLGGVTVALPPDVGIRPNGEHNFTIVVPGNVDEGVQNLAVTAGDVAEDTDLTIGGAELTPATTEVVANQDSAISGNGFSESSQECVLQGSITISNIPVQVDPDSSDAFCETGVAGAGGFTGAPGFQLTSGGTFSGTVRILRSDATVPTPFLTTGTHELKVIDTAGAEATMPITIRERRLEVTPLQALPRDTVTIRGFNYPADNPDTGTINVTITYDCGANCTRTVTADPDSSGNFRETMQIPNNAGIPSTNTIQAVIGDTNTVDTTTHQIPRSGISIEPPQGAIGTPVTISGQGFKRFDTVSEIDIGDLGVLGGRTVNTDDRGAFRVEGVVVPGLDTGVHSVEVTVGEGTDRVTANTTFEVAETAVVGVPTAINQAVQPLGENLVRVFHFNNNTKEWTFFDPRPEFTEASSLEQFVEGQPYWVRVDENQTVELGGEQRNLTCVNPGTPQEDCWNLIVW